eukprot:s7170_g5.t1
MARTRSLVSPRGYISKQGQGPGWTGGSHELQNMKPQNLHCCSFKDVLLVDSRIVRALCQPASNLSPVDFADPATTAGRVGCLCVLVRLEKLPEG